MFKSAEIFGDQKKSYTVAQQMAAAFYAGIERLSDDELRSMVPSIRRSTLVVKDAVDKAWLSPAELAELPIETVRWHNRYIGSAMALPATIDAICDDILQQPIKRPTVATLHGVCLALGRYFHYGCGLFHTLCVNAGIGRTQEEAYLRESVNHSMKEISAVINNSKDLDAAIAAYKKVEAEAAMKKEAT